MNHFGAKLRSFRKKAGYTQKELAEKLGLTVRAYQYYETGDRFPNLKKASELATILGISLDELSVPDCNAEGQKTEEETSCTS